MLYSRYYPPGTPPTTQEDQIKMAAETKRPEPTTQEDQIQAIQNTEKSEEPPTETVAENPPEEPAQEPVEEQPEVIAETIDDAIPEVDGVSGAIENRIHELVENFTVDSLREMAKEYGLSIPPRIKEANLAKMIAIHEQSPA